MMPSERGKPVIGFKADFRVRLKAKCQVIHNCVKYAKKEFRRPTSACTPFTAHALTITASNAKLRVRFKDREKKESARCDKNML
mmetsp:Transcript_29531/g.47345  ORF Transcript_29531/g.47345 Transcript_29531/m.47345 type:complete len:84 (-) Transcript_29531:1361-1612(-)